MPYRRGAIENILAYWQIGRATEHSPIPSGIQRQLQLIGQVGYHAMLAGVLASHHMPFAGKNSPMPECFSVSQGCILRNLGIVAISAPPKSVEGVRSSVRTALITTMPRVEQNIQNQLTSLGITGAANKTHITQHTGRIHIPEMEEEIPDAVRSLLTAAAIEPAG